jgi:hypothetical protein
MLRREPANKAKRGRLVGNQGATTERADQRGLITEVHGWMACDSSSAWCARCGMTRLVHTTHGKPVVPDSAQSRGGLSGFS